MSNLQNYLNIIKKSENEDWVLKLVGKKLISIADKQLAEIKEFEKKGYNFFDACQKSDDETPTKEKELKSRLMKIEDKRRKQLEKRKQAAFEKLTPSEIEQTIIS